jgi:hypothetical protein
VLRVCMQEAVRAVSFAHVLALDAVSSRPSTVASMRGMQQSVLRGKERCGRAGARYTDRDDKRLHQIGGGQQNKAIQEWKAATAAIRK